MTIYCERTVQKAKGPVKCQGAYRPQYAKGIPSMIARQRQVDSCLFRPVHCQLIIDGKVALKRTPDRAGGHSVAGTFKVHSLANKYAGQV